jgi:dihydroorotate dehydrogenase
LTETLTTELYRRLLRPALFRMSGGDPERVHEATLRRLTRLGPLLRALPVYSPPGAGRTVFGVRFPNAVGLAAGMDKDGVALAAWPALGFGHVEVGTVTRHAQPGNDRPRLYRLPASEALINRMGFNNAGAAALAARLAVTGTGRIPLGISLGKSKATPLADAVGDYVASLRALYPYGDYFAVNVSSPNTPGLRSLQDRAQLAELLGALRAEATTLAASAGGVRVRPILVKLAPDLTDHALAEAVEVCLASGVAGLIATNTTLARDGLVAGDALAHAATAGGLSGAPLHRRAVEVVRFITSESGLPVVGVGGVLHPEHAVRLFDAGASLVQLYTGLIYRGPGLVRAVARALAAAS